jgi:hypothetical protein
MSYPRISSFKTASELRTYLAEAGIDLKLDDRLQVGAAPLRSIVSAFGQR